ncbi:ArsR family transcriptional regulator [Natroniella acetigena]|uniref:ArsR family transcriptional regulator n=1 Tax=Natroniella acetigena TaxID=52004 RepID=UPI003D156EE6
MVQQIEILDSKGDHCVCELIDLIDASQSIISKHCFESSWNCRSKKEGLKVYCSLKTPCIAGFFYS